MSQLNESPGQIKRELEMLRRADDHPDVEVSDERLRQQRADAIAALADGIDDPAADDLEGTDPDELQSHVFDAGRVQDD